MAGVRGFEPLKAEPESAVIPLHHTPKINDLQYLTILHERSKGVKLGQCASDLQTVYRQIKDLLTYKKYIMEIFTPRKKVELNKKTLIIPKYGMMSVCLLMVYISCVCQQTNRLTGQLANWLTFFPPSCKLQARLIQNLREANWEGSGWRLVFHTTEF